MASVPRLADPAPSQGTLSLYQARLRLAIAPPRQVQALPDFWDEAWVMVESDRLKTAATWSGATATSSLAPTLSLPPGAATISVELKNQGMVTASGQYVTTLTSGLNSLTVTMTPWVQQVATLAGNGTSGSADGVGSGARFNSPRGMALDAAGNLYVADTGNHVIRKVRPDGWVTTLAGSGATGSVDALGTSASFNAPSGVAVDPNGNVYVADTFNHRIRLISPTGSVSTLAGTASVGSLNATIGTDATFDQPWGITLDSSGNVYVSDFNNNLIRKIATPSTTVSTFASTSLNGPGGLAIDSGNNLIVANYFDSKILKIDASGSVATIGGTGIAGFSGDNGPASSAQFNQPRAVAVDAADNLYIADTFNFRIRKILSGSSNVITLAGNGTSAMTDGATNSAQFGALFGIATRNTGSRVYVGDWTHHRLRVLIGP